MKRQIISSLVVGVYAVSAFAQNLDKRETKMMQRLKDNITYLASDELEGRGTGTRGEKSSAEFIAAEFAKNKLKPMGEEGYFQKFAITTLRIADGKSFFKINYFPEPLKLFSEFYPLSYSANHAEVTADAVDAGFGINSDLRNDYEGIDAKGKVVFINISSPDGIHPHSKFIEWHGINRRVDEAIKQGAVGVAFYRLSEEVQKPSGELGLSMRPSSIPVIFIDKLMRGVQDVKTATLNVHILTAEDIGHNVIGFKDNKAAKTVVIGAHHDHLGRGEHGNSLAENTTEIHNGADDNASGTAALIELSNLLRKSKKWNKSNNYLFIAFSGEEIGLVGSKYFVENPTIDLSTVNYMINMDMVGMLDSNKTLIINGVGTSPLFAGTIKACEIEESEDERFNIHTTQSGIGPSDHTSFYLKNIPAVHFFTGAHPYYHKPTDDVERLNLTGEVLVIDFILDFVQELNNQGKIEFTKTADSSDNSGGSRKSMSVTLGVVPNYVFDGEGMQIDAVRDGKPAERAGILAKDIIVSIAGKHIGNIKDYMTILGELSAGDEVEVEVLRNGEIKKLKVQL
ncbi:MAG: M28 family peptidase [Flavobacteriales bacterium]|nr:M28 family peptidase [Flavobacteriales bacterium]